MSCFYVLVPIALHIPYLRNQTLRLLFILLRDFVRRLFLSSLLDTAEVEESDPFSDVEEDENELEENEVVLEDC